MKTWFKKYNNNILFDIGIRLISNIKSLQTSIWSVSKKIYLFNIIIIVNFLSVIFYLYLPTSSKIINNCVTYNYCA